METSIGSNGSLPTKIQEAGATMSATASNGTVDMLRSVGSSILMNAISSVSASSSSVAPHVESMRTHANNVWSSARPWTEFFYAKKFVPASSAGEVQQRLLDNLQYFSSNYILVFVGLSTLGVIVHPMSFFCLLACLVVYAYMFVQNAGALRVGPYHLHVQAKRILFGLITFVLLYATNAVAILGSWALFSVIISLVHAGARVSVKEPDFESEVQV